MFIDTGANLRADTTASEQQSTDICVLLKLLRRNARIVYCSRSLWTRDVVLVGSNALLPPSYS